MGDIPDEHPLARPVHPTYDGKIMTCRTIPIVGLLVLFVASPVLACEAMARDAGSWDAPMDMAGGCTDDAGPGGPPVLCPASAIIAPTPHVELPGDLVAIAPNPFTSETHRFGSALPHCPRSAPSPPIRVPLYKFHAIYLI
jgi:hypothetical protein